MEKDTNIELRNEALRNVIGQVPPLLVRVGTMVIVFITLALALVVCFVPYPITIKSDGMVVETKGSGWVAVRSRVPYKFLYVFDTTRVANVTYEGEPDVISNAKVVDVDTKIVRKGNDNYFTVTLLSSTASNVLPVVKGESVKVETIVSEKTIWQVLWN